MGRRFTGTRGRIRYLKAGFDEQLGQWISDAEIAEILFTAFT